MEACDLTMKFVALEYEISIYKINIDYDASVVRCIGVTKNGSYRLMVFIWFIVFVVNLLECNQVKD